MNLALALAPLSLFDPGENGIDIGDLSLLVGVLAVIGGFVLALWRIMLRSLDRRIEGIAARLDERTKPIQPNANGGRSLPDVAMSGEWTRDALRTIAGHIGVDLPPDPAGQTHEEAP